MKQTAIQWLQEQIEAFNPKMNTNEEYEWIFRQALDIEKEQITDAFDMGCQDENIIGDEYYDATFDISDQIFPKWKQLKQ